MRSIDTIVIHCSDSDFGDRQLIDAWHTHRGFSSIGYHFVILNCYPNGEHFRNKRPKFENDGLLVEGRNIEQIGAHVKGHNATSIGICLIGRNSFTGSQLRSLQRLISKLCNLYPITKIVGHYELDSGKTCPNLDMVALRKDLLRDISLCRA